MCAWAALFIRNVRTRRRGTNIEPLSTDEIEQQRLRWIKSAQGSCNLENESETLNLQENGDGVLECHGRIQGEYPIYLPDSHLFTAKLVQEAHWRTLHGGVGLTTTKVRERYWVPRLRRLVKRQIKSCHGCRRFRAVAVTKPPPGKLPQDRTKGDHAFQVIGVDYAGPLGYHKKSGKEGKAYIVLYACSLFRAVHLELTATMETKEFLGTLKRFIARRGKHRGIKWQFNLSALWDWSRIPFIKLSAKYS